MDDPAVGRVRGKVESRIESYEEGIFVVFLSLLILFMIVGYDIIDPTNLYWLLGTDHAVHYIGWDYFRNDVWRFPVGLNPNFGIELGTGIIYSDSIPFFTILFKVFSSILPDRFQFFGLWIVVCFVLQGWFAWRLIGLFADSAAVRVLGTGFFLFAPAMIQHLLPHPSLSSHFLILASLYYYFSQESVGRRPVAWGLLLATGTLSHTYLLAIISPIWLASLVKSAVDRQVPPRKLSLELTVCTVGVAFLAWQAGYFASTSDPRTGGYGQLRGNLLSLVDPNQWSRILPDIGSTHRGDPSLYVGLGVLLLALIGLPSLFRRDLQIARALKRHWILSLALLGLSLFAVTHNVGFGPYSVELFEMNEDIRAVLSTFRASGRMLWPISYLFVLGSICIAVRTVPKRWAAALLGGALALQVVDTNAGWQGARLRHKVSPATWVDALDTPFWQMTAKRYERVRYLLRAHEVPNWATYAYYAARHGLPTDIVALARTDTAKLEALAASAKEDLLQGSFDENTLYFLDDRALWFAQVTHDPERDLVATLDGVSVLAPGLRTCAECLQMIEALPRTEQPFRVEVGEELSFKQGSDAGGLLLQPGWFNQVDWGVWSFGERARLFVPWKGSRPESIRFRAKARVLEGHPRQRVIISINGVPAGEAVLTEFSENEFTVAVPPQALESAQGQSLMLVELVLPDGISSREIGVGDSDYALAIGLMTMVLE